MSSPAATPAQPIEPSIRDADQRVFLRTDWHGYQQLLAIRGVQPRPRIAFLDGVAELMTTSIHHERIKKTIARCLEAWALREERLFEGLGEWTLQSEALQRGLEPDECYVLRDLGEADPERPDLALEVVWTHGGLNQLRIYEAPQVPEVWFWRDGAIEVHALGPEGYVEVSHSALLPEIDRQLLARCAALRPQGDAVRAFLEGTSH